VVVPGIGFSPDKMRQGRLFSYGDTQRYRLGVNYAQIPVNAPKCPVHAYHRDGTMRVDGNGGGLTHYEPNSHGALQAQPDFSEPPLDIGDAVARRWNHREDTDYFSQPRKLFELMNAGQRQALFDNTARSIKGASEQVVQRHIDNCTMCHPAYGHGVSEAVAKLG
jgi:catalase